MSLLVLHSTEHRSRTSLAPKCNHRWNCQSSVEISPVSPRIQQRHPGLSSHSTKHPLLVIPKRHPIFWDRLIQKEILWLIATWLFCEWYLLMEMRLSSYKLCIWLELIIPSHTHDLLFCTLLVQNLLEWIHEECFKLEFYTASGIFIGKKKVIFK